MTEDIVRNRYVSGHPLIFTGLLFGIVMMLLMIRLLSISEQPLTQVELSGEISPKYPQSIQKWSDEISYYAVRFQLEPDLVAALILQESGGDAQAYSKNGAVGLMQVMPKDGLAADFQCESGPCFANRPSKDELLDPDFNLEFGCSMLSGMIYRYGNIRDALKAYGPAGIGYEYADIVLKIHENYR